MTNMSDVQAMLLSAATQRESGSLLPPPAGLTNVGARVTKAVAALVKRGFAEERETREAGAAHHDDGERLFGVFVTAAGAAAIGVEDDAPSDAGDVPITPVTASAPVEPRPTKSAMVVALLVQGEGATLPDLIAATGWLPHTVRAALTGLRKKGHAVKRSKRDGVTCYRIVSAA